MTKRTDKYPVDGKVERGEVAENLSAPIREYRETSDKRFDQFDALYRYTSPS